MTRAPPFSLSFEPEVRGLDVVVGHSASVPLLVTRQGVEGEVELSGISSLPGVMSKATVPGDQAAANVTITAAGNASVREGDLIISGQLKAKTGPHRAVTPALSVRVVHPFFLTLSGDGTTDGSIAGEVVRVAPFAGKVDIKVSGLPAGLSAKPLTVDAGTILFRVDLTVSDDLPAGDYKVRLEATTPLEAAKKKTVVHSIPPVSVTLKVSRERVRIEARIP